MERSHFNGEHPLRTPRAECIKALNSTSAIFGPSGTALPQGARERVKLRLRDSQGAAWEHVVQEWLRNHFLPPTAEVIRLRRAGAIIMMIMNLIYKHKMGNGTGFEKHLQETESCQPKLAELEDPDKRRLG